MAETKTKKKKKSSSSNGSAGTKCAITREQFMDNARPIAVEIDGQQQVAVVKEFSTGSLGWHFSGKLTMMIDGVPVKVQANCLLTVVGSKEI